MESDLLFKARAHLWQAQGRLGVTPDLNVWINDQFCFNLKSPGSIYGGDGASLSDMHAYYGDEPYLKCYMKPDILRRILTRELHWNNVELACDIMFDRRPNVFLPDVHTAMSFFHV